MSVNNTYQEQVIEYGGGGGGTGGGVQGPQGFQGWQGIVGSAGVGVQGAQGWQGIVGPTGAGGGGGGVGSVLYSAQFQEYRTFGGEELAYTTTIAGGTADRFRTYLTGRYQSGQTGTVSIGVTGANDGLVVFDFPSGTFQIVIENFQLKNVFSGSQSKMLILATWNDTAQTQTFQRFIASSAGAGNTDTPAPYSLYVLMSGTGFLEHFSTEKLTAP